jgi:cell shape-determining protein MreC
MTIYDRPTPAWRAPSPAACATLLLTIAVGMLFLPERAAIALREPAHAILRPGLVAVASVRQRAAAALGFLGSLANGARHAEGLERELVQLRQRVGQLEAETVWLRSMRADDSVDSALPTAPLLRARLVEARVLGRKSQSALRREGLLDVGSQAGLSTGDLVLDVPALLDQGALAGAKSGQTVLVGRRIWGKVTQVQPRLSLVRRAADAGYRDLVRIAQPNGERLTLGPRAVLEGTGESLCRLRLVPLTEAVAVGQLIVSEGNEGFVEGRFLYGQIERVEQSAGAANWDIWVRPAVSADLPQTVAVLTAEVAALSLGNNQRGDHESHESHE